MADSLETLMEEAQEPPAPKWPSGASRGVVRVSYTHEGMIDLIIANPGISQGALAAHFGYSEGWVSQIFASDAFQARLAERREEIIDPALRATAEERFRGLVYRSLEILREKLDKPAHQVPDNLALRTAELSSRALGYGAKEQPKIEVNVQQHINDLGENLTALLRRKKAEALGDVIEGEVG